MEKTIENNDSSVDFKGLLYFQSREISYDVMLALEAFCHAKGGYVPNQQPDEKFKTWFLTQDEPPQ